VDCSPGVSSLFNDPNSESSAHPTVANTRKMNPDNLTDKRKKKTIYAEVELGM
jgi:hypothetical protein